MESEIDAHQDWLRIAFTLRQPTPMVLMLKVRPERAADLLRPDVIGSEPVFADLQYYDRVRQSLQPGRGARPGT